ncbi:MAG: PP2C family protein-serine/threonine phosphatase, partial [Pseudomonadota bacterium]
DLETRTLRYSSAGHDAPILFGDNRPTRQVEDFSGPPAGLVETMEFPVGEITLTAGDRLCIFTDGVTEAMNEDGDLFGLDRFMEIMASAPVGLTSAGLVDHAVAGVATFTGTAEQSDDLTLMIISLP